MSRPDEFRREIVGLLGVHFGYRTGEAQPETRTIEEARVLEVSVDPEPNVFPVDDTPKVTRKRRKPAARRSTMRSDQLAPETKAASPE